MKFFSFNSPNIGKYRELKKYTEKYWKKENFLNYKNLLMIIKKIKFEKIFFQVNNNYSYINIGDFSLYDFILDISCLINSLNNNSIINLKKYFSYARGNDFISPNKMTKFFNTNYHYIIPKDFSNLKIANINIFKDIDLILKIGIKPSILLFGPISYLFLSINKKKNFKKLFEIYLLIIKKIKKKNIKKIIFEEPILSCKINKNWEKLFFLFYSNIKGFNFNFSSIFDINKENTDFLKKINIFLFKNLNKKNEFFLINIIKNDLNKSNIFLLLKNKKNNFSFSLGNSKFLPYNLNIENNFIKKYLSFFFQKNNELKIIKNIFKKNINSFDLLYLINFEIFKKKILFENRLKKIKKKRNKIIKKIFINNTIGSFSQNKEIKILRKNKKIFFLNNIEYKNILKEYIYICFLKQINLKNDILVHGEFERTDMVEYFSNNIKGIYMTKNGWIQSYGTRYVKPPIIIEILSGKNITDEWYLFYKKVTKKPIKIILSGPITILKWSFFDDYIKFFFCLKLSEIINLEILKLQSYGYKIFQIDEPTIKECLSNNKNKWKIEINNFLFCFNNCTKFIKENNEIHSHVCYSIFNDIIKFIEKMNIDFLTIESTREKMENLNIFQKTKINIGAGIYDVHTPIIPNKKIVKNNILLFLKKINPIKVLINPDCGLKTRNWYELDNSLNIIKNVLFELKNIFF